MQMATAVAAIANGGYLVTPYVVDSITDNDGNVVSQTETNIRRQVISEDVSRQLLAMMENNVYGEGGDCARCHPCAHGHGRANRRRALPRRVGQLPGMAAGGFFHAGDVFWRYSGHTGQYPEPGGHCRAGAGAALWGCTLPQQLLPVQPPLHRAAGAGPRL